MARDFAINGETLVRVKGGQHQSGFPIATRSDLGLALDDIRVTPHFKHAGINCDDFGPEIPAEIMWQLADVTIRMRLVNVDVGVLRICMAEACGGVQGFFAPARPIPALQQGPIDGLLGPAGMLLGGGVAPLASGNHFISLNLLSPVLNLPWHFPTAYLNSMPLEVPLGTKYSAYDLTWRAIPYAYPRVVSTLQTSGGGSLFNQSGNVIQNNQPSPVIASGTLYTEISSSGAVLWDRVADGL